MAISKFNVQATRLVIATAGQAELPPLLIPDNCHTVIIYNNTVGIKVFIASVGKFAVGTAVDPDDSINLFPESNITLPIGVLSTRPAAGSSGQLVYDCAAPGSANVNIVYLCSLTA